MRTPRIIDDDIGTVSAETQMKVVRSWQYSNRDEQLTAMNKAREFAEGWYQAEKARDLSEFESS